MFAVQRTMRSPVSRCERQRGFSLVEVRFSLALLLVVGAVLISRGLRIMLA